MNIQRTDEWHQDRLGKPTASRYNDVMATIRSGESASRKNYRAELVAERLTNKRYAELTGRDFTSFEMQWGTDNEPLARLYYQFMTKNTVEETGFWEHDELATGASPDGLIGEDGVLEIKCPNTATHLDTLHSGKIPTQYVAQVQGQMWITGRKWADFVSFDPRLPENARIIIIPVARDDVYIEKLEANIRDFLKSIDEEVEFVRTYGTAKTTFDKVN